MAVAALAIISASAAAPIDPADVLRVAKKAFDAHSAQFPTEGCDWTSGTLMLGTMAYWKASGDTAALDTARSWAERHRYQICDGPSENTGGKHASRPADAARRPAAPTPAPGSDDSCSVFERDVSFSGCSPGATAASSPGECCALCRSATHPRPCRYFSFQPSSTGGAGRCWLDSTSPGEISVARCPGAMSGWPTGGPAPPGYPHGQHMANAQLCGATYAELCAVDRNASQIASARRVFDEEVADPRSDAYWSWVDALFMSMNTLSRLANLTGDAGYSSKQHVNFVVSAVRPGNGIDAYGFWNASASLFYRDDRFLGTSIFWGRGNGWAMGALVAAIEFGPSDPHVSDYVGVFKAHAARIVTLAGADGAWRPSLAHPERYPAPEATATANFVRGLAFGVRSGLLTEPAYRAAAEKGWAWLSTVALGADGVVGWCQPGGGSPENNYNATTTSNFCLGDFLLAAAEVAAMVRAA